MAKKYQLHDFDFNKITITTPQQNKSRDGKATQGKTAYIRSKQFPDMTRGLIFTVYGVHIAHPLRPFFNDQKPDEPPKFSLSLSFGRDDSGKPMHNIELYKALMDFEKRIIEILAQNSEDWEGEKLSTSEIKGKFTSFINKKNKNKITNEKYADTFRVRVLTNIENPTQFIPRFYDGAKKNELIAITTENCSTEIPRGTVGNIDIRISKVWISGTGMGVIFDLVQGSFNRPERLEDLEPPPPCTDEDAGRDRGTEEDDTEIRLTDEPKSTVKPGKRPQVDDEDIDDDEELRRRGDNEELRRPTREGDPEEISTKASKPTKKASTTKRTTK